MISAFKHCFIGLCLGMIFVGALISTGPAEANILANHLAVAEFDSIPNTTFQEIRDQFQFFYGHTSHGSQIMTGIGMLANEDATQFAAPSFHEPGGDLGHNGSLAWEGQTRAWLGDHPETNCVMWSWCGGCSDNTVEGINIYLNAMNQLELDFPDVVFIYMTGHLDGGGTDGTLYQNNNQIREYCASNGKILFDFADIESWDPAGVYYPNESDGCGWCADWCTENECPGCGSCAHSHCFNCYQKGKAFWWLMANVDGWDPTPTEMRNLGSVKSLYR